MQPIKQTPKKRTRKTTTAPLVQMHKPLIPVHPLLNKTPLAKLKALFNKLFC